MSLQVHSEKIRLLISQYDACHKKYQIQEVTKTMKPNQGNHDVWRKDKTGRCLIGHQYFLAILHWLTDIPMVNFSDYCSNEPCQLITSWLGGKNPAKVKMVRLLLARIANDWKSFKKLQQDTKNRKLEYQVCNMDIYHYSFPDNLNALLKEIGGLKPDQEHLENSDIYEGKETIIEYEFRQLCHWLKSTVQNITVKFNKNEVIRLWLIVSFSKSLKGQVSLNSLIHTGYTTSQ
jgi:hypothetical protein